MVAKVFSMLDMQKDKDIPIQSRKNCITILGTDPALCGKIKFNTLSNRKNVEGALPWNKSEKLREWKEIDNHYLLYYFETYYFINAEKKIFSALEMIADTNKFNPFIDMLNSVKWDGKPRVDSLLTDYLGVKKNEYSGECLRLLMLAAISRAFSPGTKFDYVLVLQGKQGIGKSTFFMKLCCNDEWYLENLKNIDKGKDSAELIQGKIIVEFGELLAMRGKTEEIKAFVTMKSDEYREPYARETEKRYRTCVFVGTTNEAQFLTDKTGNRRFLPLHCGAVPITKSLFADEDALKAEFMQAWAEVYQIYLSGKFNLVMPAKLKCYVDEALEEFREEMIMRKKILSLLLAFVMAFFVTACGESGKTKATGKTGATVGENAGEGMKIAIVSSPAGIDDHSFNEDNYNGILSFIESHPGATVTPVQEPTGDTAASLAAVADIVADYNIIVCCGFQFAGISEIAQKNPDVKFILVDTFPSDADGNEVEVDNVFAMCFAEQESGFFAGMAAALETKADKVAVVNGFAYPSNVNYQYGFECGVKYVNGTEGKNVQIIELPAYAGTDVTGADVGGNYIGSFADIETGKVIGKALIAEGVDVIFTAAGTAGSGVLAAVKEADGVWYIGCDIDQYDDGADGNRNVMLTSAIKVMHRDIERTLNAISVGFFGGGNVTLQADTGSTGYVSTEGRNQLSAGTIKKMDAAYESLILGDIVPAANFNGITPEDFTWK